MTQLSFQHQSRLWLTVALSAAMLVSVSPVPAQAQSAPSSSATNQGNHKYVREVLNQLPPGTTLANADQEALIAAIQKVILANPDAAAEIAAALTEAAPLARAVVIAEAIGRLLATNEALVPLTPAIAKAMAIALAAKTSEPERARALETAYVTSTLIYYLNPNERKNQDLIVSMVTEVFSVSPKLEYSREIFGAISATLRGLGVSEDTIAYIGNKLLDIVNDPTIRNQLRTELWNVNEGSNRFFPGVLVAEETPTTNL